MLRTDNLQPRLQIVSKLQALENAACALKNRFTRALRFFRRVDAGDEQRRLCAPAVHVSRGDFVAIGGRSAARAFDEHAMRTRLAFLRHRHLSEIAHHVRQDVGRRITDFVEHLLGDDSGRDETAGARGFGNDEGAVGVTFDNRVTDIGPIRHALPIGEEATRGLRAAFDDVAGQGTLCEFVEGILCEFVEGTLCEFVASAWCEFVECTLLRCCAAGIKRPIELMNQRPQRHGAIHATPGDHYIGAAL